MNSDAPTPSDRAEPVQPGGWSAPVQPSLPQAPRPMPAGAGLPARRTPPKAYVTYILMALTVGNFLLQQANLFLGLEVPILLDVKDNASIMRGEYWRLFTPMILHGGILHLAFNMYALSAIGPSLERYFGRRRFLALYLIAGFAGNVLSFIFNPARSVGASTAIFGLLGAEAVFIFLNRSLFAGMARQALTQILMIAGVNLLIGLSPGIDNWGHLGGLLGGVLFAALGGPLLSVEQTYAGVKVEDKRTGTIALLAGLGVFLLFAFIAAARIYGLI